MYVSEPSDALGMLQQEQKETTSAGKQPCCRSPQRRSYACVRERIDMCMRGWVCPKEQQLVNECLCGHIENRLIHTHAHPGYRFSSHVPKETMSSAYT